MSTMYGGVKKPHQWGAPPPGQGGRREQVCTQCGARRTMTPDDSECAGRHPQAVAETVHDYDPWEQP